MHQSRAGDDRQPTVEHKPPDVRQDMLRKVLDATSERQRRQKDVLRARYEPAVTKWRGSPWSAETIGCSLVELALDPW